MLHGTPRPHALLIALSCCNTKCADSKSKARVFSPQFSHCLNLLLSSLCLTHHISALHLFKIQLSNLLCILSSEVLGFFLSFVFVSHLLRRPQLPGCPCPARSRAQELAAGPGAQKRSQAGRRWAPEAWHLLRDVWVLKAARETEIL